MTGRLLRSAIVFVLAAAILAAPVAPTFAQQQQQAQQQSQTMPSYTLKAKKDYTRGQSAFPNLFAPYGPISVPKPELTDSPRVDQLIQDGKMMLSLQDALALALENNLDIAVQR
jgi:outer membrane protein